MRFERIFFTQLYGKKVANFAERKSQCFFWSSFLTGTQTANLTTHLQKIISPLLFNVTGKAIPHLKGHTINFPKKYFALWKLIILH